MRGAGRDGGVRVFTDIGPKAKLVDVEAQMSTFEHG